MYSMTRPYRRWKNSASRDGRTSDIAPVYAANVPGLNEWTLSGDRMIGGEPADLTAIEFHVPTDGAPAGDKHGVVVDAAGDGIVDAQRLYQLVRQNGTVADRTFEIRFLHPGLQAYAFTFG